MSKCISMHGEFGEHSHAATASERFICVRCGALAEDDLFDALDEARAKLARVEAAVSTWPPGPRKGDVLRAIGGEQ